MLQEDFGGGEDLASSPPRQQHMLWEDSGRRWRTKAALSRAERRGDPWQSAAALALSPHVSHTTGDGGPASTAATEGHKGPPSPLRAPLPPLETDTRQEMRQQDGGAVQLKRHQSRRSSAARPEWTNQRSHTFI